MLTLTGCQTRPIDHTKTLPADVQQLLQKRQSCQRQAAQAKQIQGCDNKTLAQAFRDMRQRYAHHPAVIKKLDGSADFD